VNTGIAIANPNDVAAEVSFFFTDVTGTNFGADALTLGANSQIARFLNQAPFNSGMGVRGSFTFTSSIPVSVVALRGFTNERSDFLITTLPVAPLVAGSNDTLIFPHFADGAGWATQVILVNPTDQTLAGTVRFLGQGSGDTPAQPVGLTLTDAQIGSDFNYSIPPRSSFRLETSNPPGATSVGSVRVTPDPGDSAPSGLGIFSFISGGVRVAEAGVPALGTSSGFRMYAEVSGMPGAIGSLRSGVAIANAGILTVTATLELTELDGTPIGLGATRTIALPDRSRPLLTNSSRP